MVGLFTRYRRILRGIFVLKFMTKIIVSVFLSLGLLVAYIFIDTEQNIPLARVSPTVVNDITQLNPIKVARVVKPLTIDEIAETIKLSSAAISIGGGRFSQGGQIAYRDSLHFDMRSFNKVLTLDVVNKQVTVQSGITWRDLQDVIDAENLSIKIMQTYANFTVGGSLSVNAHGRYIGEGPIINSVAAIKLVKADGSIVNASRTENSALFNGVIGGYGGIAVIAEVTLNLEENVKVKRYSQSMLLDGYKEYFIQHIRNDKNVVFHNADIYPPNFTDVRSVSWLKTDEPLTVKARLIPKNKTYVWQPKVAEFVADSTFGKWIRQHVMEPLFYSFDAVQWRNYEASYDVNELEPANRLAMTYALREYFIPIENFDSFTEKMALIFKKHQVNIINVSVRHAQADSGSLLAWARTEVFAFVVYYRQETSVAAKQKVKRWSQEIIDAVIAENGAYYLPYQRHATTAQFLKAYPRATEFFELKQKEDPTNRFVNQLWSQHYSHQAVN